MAHIFLPQNNNISQLLLAFGITVGFMIIEAIGGFISGSLALLADAGHMLTDTVALLIALSALVPGFYYPAPELTLREVAMFHVRRAAAGRRYARDAAS